MGPTNHIISGLESFPIGLMLDLCFGFIGMTLACFWIKSKKERGHFDEPSEEMRGKPATHALAQIPDIFVFIMVMACVFAALALGSNMIEALITMPH